MTKQTLETIKKALDMGFNIEQAYALATLEAGAKSAPKPAKKAAPAKQETPKKAPAKQEKPAKKLTAKQAAREANIEAAKGLDALALITGAKWEVTPSKHTLTGEDVWVIKPVVRFDKAAYYAVTTQFSNDLDAGYFRGGWTSRVNPTEYLRTGKLDEVATKRVAELKSARKAERDAKKATKNA